MPIWGLVLLGSGLLLTIGTATVPRRPKRSSTASEGSLAAGCPRVKRGARGGEAPSVAGGLGGPRAPRCGTQCVAHWPLR